MIDDSSSSSTKPSKLTFNRTTAILFNRLPEELQDNIWSYLREWRHKRTLRGHNAGVTSIAYSPDGAQLASGSADSTLTFWNPNNGLCLHTIENPPAQNPNGHSAWINAIAYSPDGKKLVSGSDDKTIKIWDPQTGQHFQTISASTPNSHTGGIYTLAFSLDGKQLASGSSDKTIKLWKRLSSDHEDAYKQAQKDIKNKRKHIIS